MGRVGHDVPCLFPECTSPSLTRPRSWHYSGKMDSPMLGRKAGQRPRMLVCYLCSGEFGSKSLPIHIPQCQKKWLREEELKPKKERRPLPLPPATEQPTKSGGSNPTAQEIDDFNDEARAAFEASLEQCPHCQRRFLPKAFQHHSIACTAKSPAKPAGTGLTPMSLTNRLVPGAIAGSQHGNATVQPPPLYGMSGKKLKLLKKQTAASARSSPARRDPGQSSKSTAACDACGAKYERPGSKFCSLCGSKRAGPGEHGGRPAPTSPKSSKGEEPKPWLAKSKDYVVADSPVHITTPTRSPSSSSQMNAGHS